jgi:hypothetical protein
MPNWRREEEKEEEEETQSRGSNIARREIQYPIYF